MIFVVLVSMQSIAKDPYLIQTYDSREEVPYDTRESIVYNKFCPFDRQLLSCWLVSETRMEDQAPSMDIGGVTHWHDVTSLKQVWLCECGHLWREEWNNGACWCGWNPW